MIKFEVLMIILWILMILLTWYYAAIHGVLTI